MAFDMFHDDQRAFIDHHEERMLDFIDPKNHPTLYEIAKDFYGDPVFNSNQCNEIVHELIALRVELEKDRSIAYLTAVIDRLLPFFSRAYQSGGEVRCAGD